MAWQHSLGGAALQRLWLLQQNRTMQPGLVSSWSLQLSAWLKHSPCEQLLTVEVYSVFVFESRPWYSTFCNTKTQTDTDESGETPTVRHLPLYEANKAEGLIIGLIPLL